MVANNKILQLERAINSKNFDMFKEVVDELHDIPINMQMKLISHHCDEFLEYLIYQDKLSSQAYSLSAATGKKVQNLIKCKKLKDK